MLYKGVLIANASGRLDTSVFSHNRGGEYVRALGNPNPNPATSEQTACRDSMSQLIAAWPALPDFKRLAWHTYSRGKLRPNRIGVLRRIGALPEFTRSNFVRAQCNNWLGTSLTIAELPPADDTPWPPVMPTLSLTNGSANLAVHFPTPDVMDLDGESVLAVWVSPPLPATINWYRSPMTLAAAIDSSTAGTTTNVPTGHTWASGEVCFVKLRMTRQDGGLTPAWWQRIVVP